MDTGRDSAPWGAPPATRRPGGPEDPGGQTGESRAVGEPDAGAPGAARRNAEEAALSQPSGCLPLAALLALIVLSLVLGRAFGHETSEPYADYYTGLYTAEGASCCGGPGSLSHDCEPTEARLGAQGWEALYRGHWLAIPPTIVRNVANPTGQPTLCVHRNVMLCFVPAPET